MSDDDAGISSDGETVDRLPQWRHVQNQLLVERSRRLVGEATNSLALPALRFTVVHLPPPSSAIVVTLDDACALDDVYELCVRVADACLDDDRRVTFARAAP